MISQFLFWILLKRPRATTGNTSSLTINQFDLGLVCIVKGPGEKRRIFVTVEWHNHDLQYVFGDVLVFVLSLVVVATQTSSPVIVAALDLQGSALDNNLVVGIIALGLIIYLVFTIIRPEKF